MPVNSNIPKGLYSGGTEVLNSAPYTNFYLQSMAKKRAKEEAVDGYFKDLAKNLTPAGMDNGDVDEFVSKVNEWREHSIKNRATLGNTKLDNGRSYTENMRLYNDALQYSEKSKNKIRDGFKLLASNNPAYPYTDAAMQEIHTAMLPLSKGYKPPDYSLLTHDDKPFDEAGYVKSTGVANIDLGSTVDITTGKGHKAIVTTNFKYNKDALDKIKRIGEVDAATNPKLLKYIHDKLDNPIVFNALNPGFNKAYGHDIQSEGDYVTAELLNHAKTEYSKQAIQNLQYAPQPHQNQANVTMAANTDFLTNYKNNIIAGSNQTLKIKGNNEQWLDLSPPLLEKFELFGGTVADAVTRTNNGYKAVNLKKDATQPDGFAKNKDGDVIVNKEQRFSEYDFIVNLAKFTGFGAKLGETVENATQQPANKVKKYKGLDEKGNPIFE